MTTINDEKCLSEDPCQEAEMASQEADKNESASAEEECQAEPAFVEESKLELKEPDQQNTLLLFVEDDFNLREQAKFDKVAQPDETKTSGQESAEQEEGRQFEKMAVEGDSQGTIEQTPPTQATGDSQETAEEIKEEKMNEESFPDQE